MRTGRWKDDRRSGYSFRAHFKRVVETKGFTHVALTLGATAVIAGTAFANCRGSDITGPGDPPARVTTDLASTTTATTSTVTSEASVTSTAPSKVGPMKLPFSALPPKNPCTGEDILWDREKSNLAATIQISTGTDGRTHIQYHFNSQAHGTSALRPVRYTGSQEYNSQTFTYVPEAGEAGRQKFEWNVKMIAKGESPTGGEFLSPDDDFHLHIVAYSGFQPDFVPTGVDVTPFESECH